ncbi:MAG: PepSY-associated TM helix domain-containing protein [Gammaproteobacteria bacterium]
MASGHIAWRGSLLRRALFQIHLWLGVAIGLYLCVVSTTGAALLFRIDLQRAVHPSLLVPESRDLRPTPADIFDALAIAYPTGQIAGVDSPTTARPVYLAYVTQADAFRTVLADPSTGRILGELPDSSPIGVLQDLHFNLLAGQTGEVVNGVGAICLLLLATTGMVIWWPGRTRWTRALRVKWLGNPERRVWELHGAIGIWSAALISMWAITALSFAFPQQFRSAVNALSPESPSVAPRAHPPPGAHRLPLRELIAQAQSVAPTQYVARVVLPAAPNDALQVLFSPSRPTPVGTPDLTPVYLDPYSGGVLHALSHSASAG